MSQTRNVDLIFLPQDQFISYIFLLYFDSFHIHNMYEHFFCLHLDTFARLIRSFSDQQQQKNTRANSIDYQCPHSYVYKNNSMYVRR